MLATINGIETYYETHGSGPPLIAVHGGPGMSDHRGYARWLQPLTDSYQLILYDLRGCGRSSDAPDGSYSHEDFVADLDALREHLRLERTALFGQSYGGHIALEFALRHQERLTHLVLSDTSANNWSDEIARQTALSSGLPIDRRLLDAMWYGRLESNEEFKQAFREIQPLYRATPDPEADERQLEQIVFRYRTHNYAFSRNLPSFDLTDRLQEIRVPTLILCGRHDWITPLADSEFMAERIPGARLVIFDHSGHGPMIEENERFIATVREFLKL